MERFLANPQGPPGWADLGATPAPLEAPGNPPAHPGPWVGWGATHITSKQRVAPRPSEGRRAALCLEVMSIQFQAKGMLKVEEAVEHTVSFDS